MDNYEDGILNRASYRTEGNTLTATGNLDWPLDLTFDLAVRDLIDNCPDEQLIMDFTRVLRVTSPYVGVLSAAAREITNTNRILVIRARGDVASLFKKAGLNKVAALRDLS